MQSGTKIKTMSNLYEEMLEKKAELRKKLFPNMNMDESSQNIGCPPKLIIELAKTVKMHFMSISSVNAILEVLVPYHPGLPNTVDKLLNTAEMLKDSGDFEEPISDVEDEENMEVSEKIQQEIMKSQKRLQMGIVSIKNQLTLGIAEIKGILGDVTQENRVKVRKNEHQFMDKEDMKKIKLPLENADDLERLEAQLKLVEGAAAEMQIYLNQLPTKPQYGNYASTIIRDLFSADFILECRWASKVELRYTAVMQLIVAKVLEEFPLTDETKVKDTIAQFLRKNAMLVARTLKKQGNSESEESDAADNEVNSKVKVEIMESVDIPKVSRKRSRENDDEDEEFISEDDEYFNEEHLEMDAAEATSPSTNRNNHAYVVQAQAIPRTNSIELPICNLGELENLETTLKHVEDAPNEFMEQLGFVLKHATIGKYVGKLCRSIFEEDFLLQCRWFGIKAGQVTLKHTICMRLIISKVKQEFPEIEERKIMDTLAQFFRSWACHSVKAKINKFGSLYQSRK